MTQDDIIRMAREAGMPLGIRLVNSSTEPCVSVELERFAKLVAAALEREHALHELARLGQEIEQEPSEWRDMVVTTLVREGVNKHRARELADHFAAQPEPPPEWEAINNIIAEYGLQAIDFVADWKATMAEQQCQWPKCQTDDHQKALAEQLQQELVTGRPWQGLTPEDVKRLYPYGRSVLLRETCEAIEKALKDKNT